ncbi:MAG: type IV pilus modification protein PilV [Burkholderiales bacterium]
MKNSFHTYQHGSSLLEVLIAVLIMSFGLLALGSLTAASVQYGKSAQFQTIGVQLAGEFADRMRSNFKGFIDNSYNKTSVYVSSNTVIALPSPACTPTAVCNSAQIAAVDLVEWRNDLRRRLPGGDAYVLRDPVNPLAVDIWIMWSEATAAEGLSVASNNDCPAAAVAGVSPQPRCAYFRTSI